jgi:4'-phosphopantetheinyl transferase
MFVSLGDAGAHVWHADLNLVPDLEASLDEQECTRAARYATPTLRDRYVAAHVFLRQVLGGYLGILPGEVRLGARSHGKPELTDNPEIRFSLSHCADQAVVAVARNREVGVDVEALRDNLDMSGLARRYFSAAERRWVDSAEPGKLPVVFFSCWTAKEAYVKGRGDGLLFPLDAFQVLPRPDSDVLDLRVYGDAAESCRWSMQRLHFPPGHLSTVAVEGKCDAVQIFQWPGGEQLQSSGGK